MGKIILENNVVDSIVKMSKGNPGGLTVLMKLLEKPNGLIYIRALDKAGIYGSNIWVEYKDNCGQDINKLIEKIKNGI